MSNGPVDSDDRSETKRFTTDDVPFAASNLTEGDRIAPALVARVIDGLGRTRSARSGAPPTQLAEATITDRMDDVYRALLVDGETGVLILASRHNSQSAWSQREADWKVRDVGERVIVENAKVAEDETDEWDEANAAAWANIVLQGRARGATDYDDKLTLEGRSSLTLRDPSGPTKVSATFSLAPQEEDDDD